MGRGVQKSVSCVSLMCDTADKIKALSRELAKGAIDPERLRKDIETIQKWLEVCERSNADIWNSQGE